LYVQSNGELVGRLPGLMSTTNTPEIEAGGVSQTGLVRENNQDAIRLADGHGPPENGWLYGLADGMGGYAHGDVASTLALDALFDTFYSGAAGAQAKKHLRRGIETANLHVFQTAQRMGAGRMGTTLTAAHVIGDMLRLAHVGDSRAYLVRDGRATLLTHDHTTVGDLVRMKVLSPDKVRTHAQRSILNRAIGLGLFVQPDICELPLQEGDRLILCSDGVWAVVQDHEFGSLASGARDTNQLSEDLVNLALDRDTDDNVSAIAIHIHRLAPVPAAISRGRNWLASLGERFRGNSGR
jgi:serine/threonine protein phosphatase PrpC